MTTAVFDVAKSISTRIIELEALVAAAAAQKSSNEALHNAICRACAVLLAAHLEGFLKDFSQSLIADINFFVGNFSKIPAKMKRSFCEKIVFYEGVSRPEIEGRITQLVAFFDKNSVPIDLKAFRYKENKNKNSSVAQIESTFEKIGITNILSTIDDSLFTGIFSDSRTATYKLTRVAKRNIFRLYKFPYRELPPEFKLKAKASKNESGRTSMWSEFIEAMLVRRHAVAHGDSLENEASVEELERDIRKISVLMYAIVYRVCGAVSEVIKNSQTKGGSHAA